MMDPKHAAKMKVLEELRAMAHEMLGHGMDDGDEGPGDHMKQVSVAAPDQKSLKEGLDMASGMVDDDDDYEDEDMQEDGMEPKELAADHAESPDGHYEEEHGDEDEECSPEELDAKIQELMAKKAKLARK